MQSKLLKIKGWFAEFITFFPGNLKSLLHSFQETASLLPYGYTGF